MNYLTKKNLDNYVLLVITCLTVITVIFDIQPVRPVLGVIFVLVIPGYAFANMIVDKLAFKWITSNKSPIMKVIIKIVELWIGITLSLAINPIVGFLLDAFGLLTLIAITLSLSFITIIFTVTDIFIRNKLYAN